MKKTVTFSEIMLRLATPGHSRFVQGDRFDATYAGGEDNVAVGLSDGGHYPEINKHMDAPLDILNRKIFMANETIY